MNAIRAEEIRRTDWRVPKLSERPRNQWRMAFDQFSRNKPAVGGVIALGLFVVAAVLASVIAPYDPVAIGIQDKLQLPTTRYLLGTDHFGRDILSRIIYGARISLSVGLIVVGVAFLLGVPIGLVAGYVGGRTDNYLMRVMDGLLTFPPLLLAIAIVGTLGPSIQNVMLALGIVNLPRFARLVRGSVLGTKQEVYVEAARATGGPATRIMLLHVLPNILAPIVVQATVTFSSAIVSEATLSFLGLGVQPPTPSWGRDLSEARRFLDQQPWLVFVPTAAIMVSVLAVNFIGDGLRDALDPRVRSRQ